MHNTPYKEANNNCLHIAASIINYFFLFAGEGEDEEDLYCEVQYGTS